MKKFLIILLFLSQAAFAQESLDRIVAVVNESIITQTELNQSIEVMKSQLAQNNAPIPSASVLHKQVLDQLVNRKLQLQAADQAGVRVSEEDIDKTIDKIASENKITTSELYQKLAQQGTTQSEYRKEIREEVTLQQIQQKEVAEKISLTPQEINDYIRNHTQAENNSREYHLEDILIALPEAPSPEQVAEAKTHAETLLTKIKNGLSFSEASAAESANDNALQGGDLGWRKLPEIPSAFADKITRAKEREVIGPIQTPNGFHLVMLSGTRHVAAEGGSVEDQRKQVQQLIYQRKFEEAMQHWVTRIRSGAHIDLNPVG